jgi:hypothetical protein
MNYDKKNMTKDLVNPCFYEAILLISRVIPTYLPVACATTNCAMLVSLVTPTGLFNFIFTE